MSRVDYPGIHGYTVRIQRDGKVNSKFFSDTVYGGKRKARLAAIAWRVEAFSKVAAVAPKRQVANPPGYSYIKRGVGFDYQGDFRYEYAAWVGFLRIEDRKHLVTKWSIDRWGDAEARRRCEAWLLKKKTELAFRLARARAAGTASLKRKAVKTQLELRA